MLLRRWRLAFRLGPDLRTDRLERPNARRQRVAIVFDGVVELLEEQGGFFGG